MINWAAPTDKGIHDAQVLGYKLRMKELCPTQDSIAVLTTKDYAVAGVASSAPAPIDDLTSTINSTTIAITLQAAVASGSALAVPAGAAVSQINTLATGVLAAPATADDTVIYVMVTSGTFDNDAANTVTLGTLTGKAPDAGVAIATESFGLPVYGASATTSCATIYTDYVALVLESGTTLGSASLGQPVAQGSTATGTIAVTPSGTTDQVVYVTVTSGTFTTAGTISVNGAGTLAVSFVYQPSTEPVTISVYGPSGQSTDTLAEVTGVYTPTSGQNHDALCDSRCAATACTDSGAWNSVASAILDVTTGCAGCYPRNPELDAGCFPGAAGYPTTAQTFHTIAGLRQDKYYADRKSVV